MFQISKHNEVLQHWEFGERTVKVLWQKDSGVRRKKTGIKQFPGIKNSENDTDDFHQFERVKNSPPKNEQSNSPNILGQNEDDREF